MATSDFKLACEMMRKAGKLDFSDLPAPRCSESLIDFLVRAGVASSHRAAAEGLLLAAGLLKLRDELLELPEIHGDAGRSA